MSITRTAFRELLCERILVCDGPLGPILGGDAMSTRTGPAATTPDGTRSAATASSAGRTLPELLAIEDIQRLTAIHESSAEAGADILLANTLAAAGPTLEPLGLSDRLEAIITRSIAAAREAVAACTAPGEKRRLVAHVLGPLSPGVAPTGGLSMDEAIAAYAHAARIGMEAGADLILIDGVTDLQVLRAALIGARDGAPETPVVAQMHFSAQGRAEDGTSPAVMLAVARSLDADVVGACSQSDPGAMLPIAKAFHAVTDLPLILQPSADRPSRRSVALKPREFARRFEPLLGPAVGIVGCWGAPTPHYPALLGRLVRGVRVDPPQRTQRLVIASRRRDIELGPSRGIAVAHGWTGRARQAVHGGTSGVDALVEQLARIGAGPGVHLLEIRAGMPGQDESTLLRALLPKVMAVSGCPLLLTSDTRSGLQTGLTWIAGRPLIGTMTADRASIERVVPLARRYGAAVVAACMTAKDVPTTATQKLALAEKLLADATAAGLRQEEILLDPVAGSVTDTTGGLTEIVETLRQIKLQLGQPTMLRLGRIGQDLSHGRIGLEMAAAGMAAAGQVDLLVGDLTIPPLRQAVAAAAVVAGRDRGGRRYLQVLESLDRRSSGEASRRQDRGDRPVPVRTGDRPHEERPSRRPREQFPGPGRPGRPSRRSAEGSSEGPRGRRGEGRRGAPPGRYEERSPGGPAGRRGEGRRGAPPGRYEERSPGGPAGRRGEGRRGAPPGRYEERIPGGPAGRRGEGRRGAPPGRYEERSPGGPAGRRGEGRRGAPPGRYEERSPGGPAGRRGEGRRGSPPGHREDGLRRRSPGHGGGRTRGGRPERHGEEGPPRQPGRGGKEMRPRHRERREGEPPDSRRADRRGASRSPGTHRGKSDQRGRIPRRSPRGRRT